MRKFVLAVEQALFSPSPHIVDPETREKSRILAMLQLTILLIALLMTAFFELTYPSGGFQLDVDFGIELAYILIIVFLYFINRRGLVGFSSMGFVIITTLAVFALALPTGQEYPFQQSIIFLNIPILITHFIFRKKSVIIFNLITISLLFLYALFFFRNLDSNVWVYIYFNIILSILLFIFTLHRNRMEKLHTQEREHLETQYLTLAVNIPDIIMRFNKDLRYTFVSENVFDITGLKPEIFIGRTNHELGFPDEVAADSLTRLEEVFRLGQSSHDVFQLPTPKGNLIFDCRTIPEFNKNGHVFSVFAILRNITEQARLEEQLKQTQKMEAIGLLAGGVAHDFNNQLMGIIGFAELLALELKDSPLFEHAEHILQSAKRASDTTNKLLSFAHKGNVTNEIVDLHNITREVIEMLKHSADKRINFVEKLQTDPCTTLGDASQLQNALLNLAINSCDAMRGGGTLTFETALVEAKADPHDPIPINLAPGQYVRVRITDTGVGIDKNLQEHIFEPFFTTKAQGEGTGLGLAAVYGIIHNHRGAVSIDSNPGKGTAVDIFLPVRTSRISQKKDVPESQPKHQHTGRVMIIDDEKSIVETVSRMIAWLGYEVEGFTDIAAAVDFFEKHRQSVDLVLLDMMMPIMSGGEVFSRLKSINPRVKVLLSSGFTMNSETKEVLKDGAIGFLQKPFRMATLAEKLEGIMNVPDHIGTH